MSDLTVIVASPDVDGVASAAIVARGIEGSFETFFMGSEELPGFFEPSVQLKLPRMYTLVICGLNVVYMSWDGELVRPD
ncbi:MAG: hypothetical protein KGZ25_13210, partial [Planctomycetes bacterium]|nr:hypothetical protein [Planctomycetota bacterium]